MQTIFWHCPDIAERAVLEVCLNCGETDTILFPNDGCWNCGGGLEWCVRFISKKQYKREMEEEAQKEIKKIAEEYIKAVAGDTHANP